MVDMITKNYPKGAPKAIRDKWLLGIDTLVLQQGVIHASKMLIKIFDGLRLDKE